MPGAGGPEAEAEPVLRAGAFWVALEATQRPLLLLLQVRARRRCGVMGGGGGSPDLASAVVARGSHVCAPTATRHLPGLASHLVCSLT